MVYYELGEVRRNLFVLPGVEWRRTVLGRHFCQECWAVLRWQHPQAMDVCVDQLPDDTVAAFVFRAYIGVARKDLLEILQPYLRGFAVGRCFDPKGQLIEDYATFYSRAYVITRGGPETTYHTCPACGTVRTAFGQDDEPYLLAAEIGDRAVVHDWGCRTLISERALERVSARTYPNLRPIPRAVLQDPRDNAGPLGMK